jgi:hypothetical protein
LLGLALQPPPFTAYPLMAVPIIYPSIAVHDQCLIQDLAIHIYQPDHTAVPILASWLHIDGFAAAHSLDKALGFYAVWLVFLGAIDAVKADVEFSAFAVNFDCVAIVDAVDGGLEGEGKRGEKKESNEEK